MHVKSTNVRGFKIVGPGDLEAIQAEFEEVLLPHAKAAKIYPIDETPQSIIQAGQGRLRRGVTTEDDSPIGIARGMVDLIAGLIVIAKGRLKIEEVAKSCSQEIKDLDWAQVTQQAGGLMTHTYGYISAILDMNSASTVAAIKGRKAIGSRTREKVRAAALLVTRKISRDQAAPLIAAEAGISEGRARKLLSEEFRGEKWNSRIGDSPGD